MRVTVCDKRFGDHAVLRDVVLDLPDRGVVAVTGPSGCGKTTLLRLIAGLDIDFVGEIAPRPATVAFVFQEPTLLPWRTAMQNVALALGDARDAEARARAALADVELAGREDAYPGALSLGQQRRVALARALAADADLLLLDEPFASLDTETAARLRTLALEQCRRRQGRAILVTHDIEEALFMADRVAVLEGAPATLKSVHATPPRGGMAARPSRMQP